MQLQCKLAVTLPGKDLSYSVHFKSEENRTSSNLQKFAVKTGRGQSKLVEQAELTVKREYLVLWKKQIVDPNKLAKLYWDQGLS